MTNRAVRTDKLRPMIQIPSAVLRGVTPVTRQLNRLNGLNPALRPLRPARGAALKVLERLHQPGSESAAIESVVHLGGHVRMRVNTYDLIERQVFLVGFEPEVRALIRRQVREGRACIDVGANAGVHALTMATAVGRRGRVLACEPNPRVAARLRDNAKLSGTPQLAVHEVAIGDQVGTTQLYVPLDHRHGGGASLHQETHAALAGNEMVEVPLVTIDDLLSQTGVRGVDLVKIDIEGFEAPAVRGGVGLLRRERPTLIFEYTPAWWQRDGESLEDVLSLLRNCGYASFQEITRRGLVDVVAPFSRRMDVVARP